jgi:hypothetical protein
MANHLPPIELHPPEVLSPDINFEQRIEVGNSCTLDNPNPRGFRHIISFNNFVHSAKYKFSIMYLTNDNSYICHDKGRRGTSCNTEDRKQQITYSYPSSTSVEYWEGTRDRIVEYICLSHDKDNDLNVCIKIHYSVSAVGKELETDYAVFNVYGNIDRIREYLHGD